MDTSLDRRKTTRDTFSRIRKLGINEKIQIYKYLAILDGF